MGSPYVYARIVKLKQQQPKVDKLPSLIGGDVLRHTISLTTGGDANGGWQKNTRATY